MIVNGKVFVQIPEELTDLKEIFHFYATSGAGRSVDHLGLPPGSWTPELLADAISTIEQNDSVVDVRTVQRWFQLNDRGIKAQNIHWLSVVFGCGDIEATRDIQVKLNKANWQLNRQRKAERRSPAPLVGDRDEDAQPNQQQSVAEKTVALFRGRSAINSPIVIWAGMSVLWFMAYIAGVHDISYDTGDDRYKQVGFFWSPSWNIGDLILLPIFVMMTNAMLDFWVERARVEFVEASDYAGWTAKVNEFSSSFIAIFFVCFVLVFLLQWVGVYLIPLSQEDRTIRMVDWILVANFRPEDVSRPLIVVISLFAFAFSAIMYVLYFVGLLLTFIAAADFEDLAHRWRSQSKDTSQDNVSAIATELVRRIYCCIVLGVLLAMTIKFNAAYLVSDADSISGWLYTDFVYALGRSGQSWGWIGDSPSPFFTSFLLIFVTIFVFLACLMRVRRGLRTLDDDQRVDVSLKREWHSMVLVLLLLTVCFGAIGRFYGFSMMLFFSLLVVLASLYRHLVALKY